jgi:hypothetical protein
MDIKNQKIARAKYFGYIYISVCMYSCTQNYSGPGSLYPCFYPGKRREGGVGEENYIYTGK